MTNPKTCKTCKWWGDGDPHSVEGVFAKHCQCKESQFVTKLVRKYDTCDKYESRDRQGKLKL